MNIKDLALLVKLAVKDFKRIDSMLLELGAHEQTISHRISGRYRLLPLNRIKLRFFSRFCPNKSDLVECTYFFLAEMIAPPRILQ